MGEARLLAQNFKNTFGMLSGESLLLDGMFFRILYTSFSLISKKLMELIWLVVAVVELDGKEVVDELLNDEEKCIANASALSRSEKIVVLL